MAVVLVHASSPREQPCEGCFVPDISLDLATDVADDPAEIGPQRLQHLLGALELLGVSITAARQSR
jgi:hypothetical protein